MRARPPRDSKRRHDAATAAARRRGIRIGLTGIAVLLLASCGGGREQVAASACDKAVQAKLAGRNYELSVGDLASHAKAEGADVMHLSSQITFDKSLSSEYKQTVDCKVRFEAGKDPSVIFLQFNWSMDDVKKN